MAVNLNSSYGFRRNGVLSESLRFRRKGKSRAAKIKRKVRIRLKHIMLLTLCLAALFLLAQQACLFLLAWDQLNVKDVAVYSNSQNMREAYVRAFSGIELGNILSLNIQDIRRMLEKPSLVKDVTIRKVFPSSLEIYVRERVPAARIDKGRTYLIDRENVILQELNPGTAASLPLITDKDRFKVDFQRKMESVWMFLDSLSPPEKEQISLIDVSNADNLNIYLDGDPTRIILGKDNLAQKIALYRKNKTMFEKYGSLEYVDLRFQDRVYIKPSGKTVHSGSTRR